MQKRKTKFKSIFQSDAKTKKRYEVQIRFSKLDENEKFK